ncbi:MAG: glycosyltransferase family 2 protein [Proteobacteria bacterium]|nr:glycosyltransferase family 2 protein [Pseudomonadota bacterium]
MSVAVIIVNYNTGAMLNDVVIAALKNESVAEIAIIDNNSQDNSMELVAEHRLVRKYFRKKNHGFAASCNYGAQQISSTNILFLNPDCLVGKTSIDDLLMVLNNDPNAAIIGCRVNNPNGTEQRACRRRLPTLWRAIKTFTKIEKLAPLCNCFAGVNLNHQPMPTSIQNVEAISGALILITTNTFNQINGFDETFPLHFEDLDLFIRVRNNGNTILFHPQVTVTHHQGLSSQSNPKVAEFKQQGLVRYFHKHRSLFSYLVIRILCKKSYKH